MWPERKKSARGELSPWRRSVSSGRSCRFAVLASMHRIDSSTRTGIERSRLVSSWLVSTWLVQQRSEERNFRVVPSPASMLICDVGRETEDTLYFSFGVATLVREIKSVSFGKQLHSKVPYFRQIWKNSCTVFKNKFTAAVTRVTEGTNSFARH